MKTTCDFLVIGSGIAGLSFAIHASRYGSVIMITKKSDSDSNTNYAQGGIACVLDEHDSYEQHIRDTLIAGAGICNEKAVEICVRDGPARIEELLEWGTKFSTSAQSRVPHHFDLGKEGAHSAHRIVHAKDHTGKEVEESLLHQARCIRNISLYENHSVVEFITNHHCLKPMAENRCLGAYVLDTTKKNIMTIRSKITLCATGGAGKVYLHSTNPDIATGDGVAMAYRAGAKIGNMEFIQFHPTTLYHEHANRFLISEALRGFGAILKDKNGREFMKDYHPQGH
jgi:L-aspartate oxidase